MFVAAILLSGRCGISSYLFVLISGQWLIFLLSISHQRSQRATTEVGHLLCTYLIFNIPYDSPSMTRSNFLSTESRIIPDHHWVGDLKIKQQKRVQNKAPKHIKLRSCLFDESNSGCHWNVHL